MVDFKCPKKYLKMNGEKIEVQEFKYLGLVLHKHGRKTVQ